MLTFLLRESRTSFLGCFTKKPCRAHDFDEHRFGTKWDMIAPRYDTFTGVRVFNPLAWPCPPGEMSKPGPARVNGSDPGAVPILPKPSGPECKPAPQNNALFAFEIISELIEATLPADRAFPCVDVIVSVVGNNDTRLCEAAFEQFKLHPYLTPVFMYAGVTHR